MTVTALASHASCAMTRPITPPPRMATLIPGRIPARSSLCRPQASGVISDTGYLFARPQPYGRGGLTWMLAGICAHAVRGDAEHARDLYAAAAYEDASRTIAANMDTGLAREGVDAFFDKRSPRWGD